MQDDGQIALDVKELHKTYKGGLEALGGISFSVRHGDFFALLGPNGAGKSTTIRILTGLVTKSAGKVNMLGYDIDENFPKARARIGVVPQEHNFSLFQNCRDIIINQAGYYGIPRKVAAERCDYYLDRLGLANKGRTMSRNLSGGMRRKLMLARSMVNQPALLFLDEPTAGLDVEFRRELWYFLRELNANGTTIVLTTHYLEEVEQLCNRVAIIQDGDIIEDTSLRHLLQRLDSVTYIVESHDAIASVPEAEGYAMTLQDEYTLQVEVHRDKGLNELFSALMAQGIKVSHMYNRENRLEQLFMRMTTADDDAA